MVDKMEWELTEGENDIKEMLIKFKVVHLKRS